MLLSMNAKKKVTIISLKLDTKAHDDQTAVFVNVENKVQFIQELTHHLVENVHSVTFCYGDADTIIVPSALDLARNEQSVEFVADDTEILILLIFHWEPKKMAKLPSIRIYNIRRLC